MLKTKDQFNKFIISGAFGHFIGQKRPSEAKVLSREQSKGQNVVDLIYQTILPQVSISGSGVL